MSKLTALALLTALCLLVNARADDAKAPPTLPPASTKTDVTYATDIKPIFDASCVKCHNGDRAKAKLHMDTLEGVLKGTKNGSIITAGTSAKSWIVLVTAHATDDNMTWMPPLENKAGIKPLTSGQIGLIRAWIDQGAK
jgi:mono/diheme cytochrome c family protein